MLLCCANSGKEENNYFGLVEAFVVCECVCMLITALKIILTCVHFYNIKLKLFLADAVLKKDVQY